MKDDEQNLLSAFAMLVEGAVRCAAYPDSVTAREKIDAACLRIGRLTDSHQDFEYVEVANALIQRFTDFAFEQDISQCTESLRANALEYSAERLSGSGAKATRLSAADNKLFNSARMATAKARRY